MKKNKLNDSVFFWSKAHEFIGDYMPNVRGADFNTIDAYRCGLNLFIAFLVTIKNKVIETICLADFSQANIKDFQRWNFKTKGLAPRTCNLRTSAIRSFLEFMVGEDNVQFMSLYIDSKRVKKIIEPDTPIEYYSKEQMSAILHAPNCNTRIGRRNRALLCLLYDTGARVSEIVGLKLNDFRRNVMETYITVFGKGKKYRDIPILDPKTLDIFDAYIKEFHPTLDKERPLFYAYSKNSFHALSTDTVALVLKQCVKKAEEEGVKMPSSNHCHMIRKTRGMHLYEGGVPLSHIQELFGHENSSTTSRFYVFATKETLARELKKFDESEILEKKTWKEKDTLTNLYKL